MDYLPIQASSVPCERVFLSSAETDTKRRNRISPLLMEALQMQKFQLKTQRLDFMEGWITPEKLMLEVVPDKDLLEGLSKGDASQEDVDNIIQSISRSED
jgi:hypothetical protein